MIKVSYYVGKTIYIEHNKLKIIKIVGYTNHTSVHHDHRLHIARSGTGYCCVCTYTGFQTIFISLLNY